MGVLVEIVAFFAVCSTAILYVLSGSTAFAWIHGKNLVLRSVAITLTIAGAISLLSSTLFGLYAAKTTPEKADSAFTQVASLSPAADQLPHSTPRSVTDNAGSLDLAALDEAAGANVDSYGSGSAGRAPAGDQATSPAEGGWTALSLDFSN
jgi:FlaG/FlaF family flagellin (archaellin)